MNVPVFIETCRPISHRHYATALKQNERHSSNRRSALPAAQLRFARDEKTIRSTTEMWNV